MAFSYCSLDTCVILRLILADIEDLYERALDLITENGMYFYVSDYAIGEAVHVLEHGRYQFPRAKIIQAIRGVMQAPRLDYCEPLFDQVFDLYENHPKLSFNDCYLACKMADLERMPFYTFDEKLARQHPAAKLIPA